MDEALGMIKQVQNNKESAPFKSGTQRFKDPKLNYRDGARELEMSADERKRIVLEKILGDPSAKMINQSMFSNGSKPRPFDSSFPRFNYNKQSLTQAENPGPGQYGPDYETKTKLKQIEIATTGTVDKKFVTGLGVENR